MGSMQTTSAEPTSKAIDDQELVHLLCKRLGGLLLDGPAAPKDKLKGVKRDWGGGQGRKKAFRGKRPMMYL